MFSIESVFLAPESLAYEFGPVPAADQPLFGAVIKAWNPLQRELAGQCECGLIVITMWIAGVCIVQARILIVIIEKGDEVAADFALRADQRTGQLLAMSEHLSNLGRRRIALGKAGKLEKEREIERGIYADEVATIAGVASDEARDLLLLIVYFAEGKEILLPDTQRVLPDSRAEFTSKIGLEVFQRIDAESVDVVLGDEILMCSNQDAAHRIEVTIDRMRFAVTGVQFFEREEVAGLLLNVRGTRECVTHSAEVFFPLQFDQPDQRILGNTVNCGRRRPIGSGMSVRVTQHNRIDAIVSPGRVVSVAFISKYIASMIKDDIEYHINATRMRRVDQLTQFRLDKRR